MGDDIEAPKLVERVRKLRETGQIYGWSLLKAEMQRAGIIEAILPPGERGETS